MVEDEEVAKVVGPFECSSGEEHTDWKNYIIECSTTKTKNWNFDFQHEGTPASEVIPDKATLAAFAAAIVLFGLLEIVDRIAVRDE